MLNPDSIHKAMVEAAWNPDTEINNATVATRTKPTIKELAESICVRNNTTLSAFLRECLISLCKEYGHKE